MGQKNRRQRSRFRASSRAKVECRVPGQEEELAITLLDISEMGMRLVLGTALRPGQEVEVALFAEVALAKPVKRRAHIVWTLPLNDGNHCAGMRFQQPLRYFEMRPFIATLGRQIETGTKPLEVSG